MKTDNLTAAEAELYLLSAYKVQPMNETWGNREYVKKQTIIIQPLKNKTMKTEELEQKMASISDAELIEKAQLIIKEMCLSGRIKMTIPVNPKDEDIILGQLLKRLKAYVQSNNAENVKHLEWIYNRMANVHNESVNFDYMIKFKAILTSLNK